jgi:hypothetical protein
MDEPKSALGIAPFEMKTNTMAIRRPVFRALLAGGVLFVIFIAFMAAIQFATPDLPDNDGYYHIKLAALMRTEGLKPPFPYLPLSILNAREFADHHFLFHVALIPFTFGDLRLGAKWASICFAGIAFLSVWWLLQRQKIPYPGVWALGLLGVSEAFIYRMSIARAQSLSLAVLALGLSFLLEKRYKLLAPLAFFYVWLYDAFPLLIFLVVLYVLAVLLIERRLAWQPLLYAGVGILLGILINPYFPQNVIFLVRHLLPKLAETTAVSVGNEWYPYDTSQLLENSPLALIVFFSGVIALGLNNRRMDLRTTTALFLSILFGLMLFQSRRFIEYFPAFGLIFSAFAWTPLIESWQTRRLMATGRQGKRPFWAQVGMVLPGILLLVLLAPGIYFTFSAAQKSIQASKPSNLFQGASAWLEKNTPPGSRVFQTDWDDFPRLFFYNTQNTYLIGLDPTYMQLYNSDLYDEWVSITRGRVANPSLAIRDRFGAKYVISDLLHQDFIQRAEEDVEMIEVYRDLQSVVYQVR